MMYAVFKALLAVGSALNVYVHGPRIKKTVDRAAVNVIAYEVENPSIVVPIPHIGALRKTVRVGFENKTARNFVLSWDPKVHQIRRVEDFSDCSVKKSCLDWLKRKSYALRGWLAGSHVSASSRDVLVVRPGETCVVDGFYKNQKKLDTNNVVAGLISLLDQQDTKRFAGLFVGNWLPEIKASADLKNSTLQAKDAPIVYRPLQIIVRQKTGEGGESTRSVELIIKKSLEDFVKKMQQDASLQNQNYALETFLQASDVVEIIRRLCQTNELFQKDKNGGIQIKVLVSE